MTDWDDPDTLARNRQPCCDAAIEAQASLTKELAELRERVSNAFKTVKRYIDETNGGDAAYIWAGGETVMFSDFIQPEPVDPLVERAKHIAAAVDYANSDWTLQTEQLKAARCEEILARHGLTITEVVSTDTQREAK